VTIIASPAAGTIAALAEVMETITMRSAKFAAAIGLLAGLTAGCGQVEEPGSRAQGLTIERASSSSLRATYLVGHTSLVITGELRDGVATARITYPDGTVVTEMAVPEARQDGQATELRSTMERSADAAAAVVGQFADDKARVTEMTLAYQAIATGLDKVLEPSSAMRSAALFQPTVLATSIVKLAPASVLGNGALEPASTGGYATGPCSGCAPNDDSDDYYGEPTWSKDYDSAGNPIGGGGVEYRVATFGWGSGCFGACGPGCEWCTVSVSGYRCHTNTFCEVHDAHCGAWLHFFTCW